MSSRPRWAQMGSAVGLSALIVLSASCGDDTAPAGTPGATSAGGGGATGGGGAMVVGGGGTGGDELPETFEVTGVVTDGTAPLEGAIILQGGGQPLMTTGADGAFTIELTQAIAGRPTVVAAKEGYRSAAEEFFMVPTAQVQLVLLAANPPDNTAYVFGHPGLGSEITDDSTEFCGHCHTTMAAQFQTSAHAESARDPELQDLYAGVTRAHTDQAACESAGGEWKDGATPGQPSIAMAKCYIGNGVLADLNSCGATGQPACDDPALPAVSAPTSFGACADCHAIGMDGPAGGRNLLDATGIGYEFGNHCDACHHVADVDLNQPAGLGGRLKMQRPKEKLSDDIGAPVRQVMFGPYADVVNSFMGGSYQPKFATSVFCGGCHDQHQPALIEGAALDPQRWPDGLPTHSTYSEWEAGPWNAPETQCRFCHMPAVPELFNTVDVSSADNASIVFGFERGPDDIRSHIFRGPLVGSPRLVDTALSLSVSPVVDGGELNLSVAIENIGAGHAVPTGEPMRSVLLSVRVDGCGESFAATGGMTVPDFGGAQASGLIGTDVLIAGTTVTWTAGADAAAIGDVVRVVRPSGIFDDYIGVGFFGDPLLAPYQKGMEIAEPVGTRTIVAVNAGTFTLDGALAVQPGDRMFVGASPSMPWMDGAPSISLAGAPGYGFGRVMVDATGARGVHHYRANDIASDNRIPPGSTALTHHRFAIPVGCTSADVRVEAIYRPLPEGIARKRGWDARDYVIGAAAQTVALP